jgi:hypothetical protein
MSTSHSKLRDPRVIAVVALALVGVGIANVLTFAPNLAAGRKTRQAAIGGLSVPGDLEQLARAAGRGCAPVDSGDGSASQRHGDGDLALDALRDPFRRSGMASATGSAVTSPARSRRPPALRCSAVMLGGGRPLALLNDETAGIGDRVRGWEVAHISARGVRLRRGGEEQFLAVENPPADPSYAPPVSGQGTTIRDKRDDSR